MQPLDFLKSGIAVIPVLPFSKKPSVRWLKYQHRLPTHTEQSIWFRPGRQINYAVICGWRGLVVLDFDAIRGFLTWQSWAIAEGGAARRVALETYRVRTSRGMHVYLFVDDMPRCGKFQWGDIKGRGGYVLIPPSVHPSGAIYMAVDEAAPVLRVQELGEVIPDPPPVPAVWIPTPTRVYATSSLWPATILEQIKERISVLEYFPDARHTGQNRWYVAQCPFHQDRNPSLWIDTVKGLVGCYAGCTSRPLDVVGLHARLHGMDDRAAIRELGARL